MMFAKMNQIPVVSWLPVESHYHRETIHLLGQHVTSWIHPFVYSLSDYLAPSLEHAAQWILNSFLTGQAKIKGSEIMQEAMQHYLATQLQQDNGMQEIVQKDHYFSDKIDHVNEQSCNCAVNLLISL
jgi:hypothetical protein